MDGRGTGALRIGAPRRLAHELATPCQEGGVGQVVSARRHLLGHGRHAGFGPRLSSRDQRSGGPEDQCIRTVGQGQHHDDLVRFGPVQHVGQRHPGVRCAQVAERGGEVRRQDAASHTQTCRRRLDGAGV